MITKLKVENTKLEGVKLITPFCASDERGCLIKDYSKELFERDGICHELKEIFYTVSNRGVIRAIHFQRVKEQAKLVRCISGRIFDVVVDLRKESQTFGKWEMFELTGENQKEILVPEHFGHGYLVAKESIVSYKCAEQFCGEYDDGIIWNDPDINIKWPVELVENIILSEKDKGLQTFLEFKNKYC